MNNWPIEILLLLMIGMSVILFKVIEILILSLTKRGRLIIKSMLTGEYVDTGNKNYLVRYGNCGESSYKMKKEVMINSIKKFNGKNL